MRPRIIFTDGFGAGQVQSIGYSVPYSSIVQPLTAVAVIRDPFSGLSGTGINPLAAAGRYAIMSGDTHQPTLGAPLNGVVGAIDFSDIAERWQYVATGGRGGGGCVVSVAGGSGRPGGHWNGIAFRTDSPPNAAGIVLGMDLQNAAIPAAGLTCIGFVSEFVANLLIHSISSPLFGIIPTVVVTITPNRTIELRRLNITQEPGHAPHYYGTGTWVTLATSTVRVPSTGPFTIEAGRFRSAMQTVGGMTVPVANGFAFARLYTPSTPFGVMAARALTAVTGRGTEAGGGVVWGTDARGEFGDGAGNVTQGIAGIKFDGVVAYDNGGAASKYLYDCRVGTSFPTRDGETEQSTPHGSTRLLNIARALNALAGLEDTYNRYSGTQRDLFVPQPARPQAAEILALVPFKCTDSVPPGSSFPGQGKILLAADGIELGRHVSASGSVTSVIDDILVAETNPSTSRAFAPAEIGSSVRVGWQNDKPVEDTADTVVFQLGLEYVYRERVVRIVDHPPLAAAATFGYVADLAGNTIDFQDTSIKYDGVIVANHWDWGDGSTSDNVGGQWSGSLSAHHVHTYAAPGTYTVVLTVTGADGTVGTVSHDVVVPNQAPSAGFTFLQAPGSLLVAFTDASTDPDGTITGRLWDFGDSNTSAATNPSHTYSAPGTYTVTLTVTDNLGATNAVSQSLTAPPASAGCPLSSFALADTPSVQGDDFHGGNPPLPSYANTAAFAAILGTRLAYEFPNFSNFDGVDFAIDGLATFHGHSTLKMALGVSGLVTYQGSGWLGEFSDDGDPTEVAATPTAQWMRVRWAADAGIVSGAAVGAFAGLEICSMFGHAAQVSLFVRGGRVMLDIRTFASNGTTHLDTSVDLGPESLFVGRSGLGEAILLYDSDNTAHTVTAKAWAADACSLAGVSPLSIQTVTAYPKLGFTTAALKLDSFSLLSCAFTPSGGLKYITVGDWETMPASVSGNPFGVSLT